MEDNTKNLILLGLSKAGKLVIFITQSRISKLEFFNNLVYSLAWKFLNCKAFLFFPNSDKCSPKCSKPVFI